MKRIEECIKQISERASDYLYRRKGPGILQLCGCSGMGKTLVAQEYCRTHNGLYFSFRNLDAAFAPHIFMPGCHSWQDFMEQVRYAKNRPVIFFDDMDDRNDKDIFFALLPLLADCAYVVLICRREITLPPESAVLHMRPMNPVMLRRESKRITPLDTLRIMAMTDGIPALVSLFDLSLSFEENVRNLFVEGPYYLRYAPEELHRVFRSPESYNTLLYGLAIGHNRISQLAEFSGFPKNKCDKYLKALEEAGFVETEQRKDDTGKIRTHYYPKGGYLRAWYLLYFPRQERFFVPPDDDTLLELLLQIDDVILRYYFRKCCWQWLRHFFHDYYWDRAPGVDKSMQYDVTVHGVKFDFIQYGRHRDIYVKILDGVDERISHKWFQEIEAATTKTRPFYNNLYYIFSIQTPIFLEDLRNLDNVVLMDAEKFFTRDYYKFLERM